MANANSPRRRTNEGLLSSRVWQPCARHSVTWLMLATRAIEVHTGTARNIASFTEHSNGIRILIIRRLFATTHFEQIHIG